ncbi:MAG: TetR/AcrR family transcriptional regulator [Desulfotomaculales bacterium]
MITLNRERWEEILTVSARLFREKGYRATTLDDIAAELNVTKPALYYYIKTKLDLLYAVCELAINQLLSGAKKIKNSEASLKTKLCDLIRLHVNMFSQSGDITSVFLAEENELPPEKRTYFRSLSREYEKILREILQDAVDSGLFRPVDVPLIARAISGMCNWLSAWYKPGGSLTADQVAEAYCDLLLNGLLRKD